MLRFHFTADDLARVRMTPGPDPLWEALLSAHLLHRTSRAAPFDRWRRQVVGGLTPKARMLPTLAPPRGYSPDFLTPDLAGSTDLDAAVERVQLTPRRRLRTELELLAAWRRPCGWIQQLSAGDPAVLEALGTGLREYHRSVLAPSWERITGAVEADRARQAAAFLEAGVDGMLAGLHPSIRWTSPVLELTAKADRDIHLAGRGIRLIPSFFCWRDPITLLDPELVPVLVYPVPHPRAGDAAAEADDGRQRLSALLGRTRASTLRALTVSASTSGVARRLGISVASASEHTRVLREAGLIESRRDQGAVRHSLTGLGRSLLAGTEAAEATLVRTA
ncbi:winged helix-turn-helix domain-containing protein [Microlunatus soli]|uniref:Helix-turn-helix domain-containing protein n=1 Tax=Microlunatus soli TaxID=630515 RepID=A0A1H1Z7U9_9ACTN|nr:winged helix-turn-helix domain-containing protein [Microlunatus soli]SDT29592.1 Helix-turn-helix domain-containing protein [Microlunatus soli]